MRWAFIVVMLLSLPSAAARADTIYRCAGPDGEVYFTDRACTGGAVQRLDPADVLTLPAPDAADMARAQRLGKEQAARARLVQKARSAQQRAEMREVAARARSCAAARDGLDRVHRIKRRGYAVASAADLDARERKYNLLAQRNCS